MKQPKPSTNAGYHTKGTMVVLHYGELELWIPWPLALSLGTMLVGTAKGCRKLDQRAVDRRKNR